MNKVSTSLDAWDLTFISEHNPDEFATHFAIQEFALLDHELVSLQCFKECIPSYARVQNGLLEGSTAISKSNDSHYLKSQKFYQLYSSVIEQLRALIAMVKKMNEEKYCRKDTVGKSANKSLEKGLKKQGNNVKPSKFSKEAFTKYMNQWMRDNWENPYPDEECLEEIALCNGTTPSTVNNWLINARTRKWRPAIIKACKSGRTADTLKEDSINIFDGRDVTGKANVVT